MYFIQSNPKTPSDTELRAFPSNDKMVTLMEQEYVAIKERGVLELCHIFVLLIRKPQRLLILGIPVQDTTKIYLIHYEPDTADTIFADWSNLSDGSRPSTDLFSYKTMTIKESNTLDQQLLKCGIDSRDLIMLVKCWKDIYKLIYR